MTPTKTRPHKPMLAEWTCEILSLSLHGHWYFCVILHWFRELAPGPPSRLSSQREDPGSILGVGRPLFRSEAQSKSVTLMAHEVNEAGHLGL